MWLISIYFNDFKISLRVEIERKMQQTAVWVGMTLTFCDRVNLVNFWRCLASFGSDKLNARLHIQFVRHLQGLSVNWVCVLVETFVIFDCVQTAFWVHELL